MYVLFQMELTNPETIVFNTNSSGLYGYIAIFVFWCVCVCVCVCVCMCLELKKWINGITEVIRDMNKHHILTTTFVFMPILLRTIPNQTFQLVDFN